MSGLRRQLGKRLTTGRPALLVSLPRNDMELARAAVAGGAEGLKVHINLHHHASGTHFGSLTEEEAFLEQVVALGLPVGIVPGDDKQMALPEDMERLDQIGIDFFDAYLDDMPAWMLALTGEMSVMVAFGPRQAAAGFDLAGVAQMVQMIEASIIEHEGYGQPLNAADIAAYSSIIRRWPELPVMVPTQRRILPEEVGLLAEIGVRMVLIGAIVTGKDAGGIEQTTARFRAALDRL